MKAKVRKGLLMVLILWAGWCFSAEARQITDMAGRRVTVPDEIRKVFGASPPATYMIYAFDPSMVAGINFPFEASEKRYSDPSLHQLPLIGWFGQGRTVNLETLLLVRPDIALVWRQQDSAIYEKIERTLNPLNIPIVYIVFDTIADYPAVFRFLGELFGRQERARALGNYAEQSLSEVARVRAAVSDSDRVSVYYAEGADGLSTECHVSMHTQLIPLSGGYNVHRCEVRSTYGMQKISMEQLLQYDPQVIVSHEPLFFNRVATDSKWQNLRAVRDGRVYKIPRTPFNWFDRPPSFMRLLGIKWLTHHLYPEIYPIDLVAETQRFYELFLNVKLDEEATRELLQP